MRHPKLDTIGWSSWISCKHLSRGGGSEDSTRQKTPWSRVSACLACSHRSAQHLRIQLGIAVWRIRSEAETSCALTDWPARASLHDTRRPPGTCVSEMESSENVTLRVCPSVNAIIPISLMRMIGMTIDWSQLSSSIKRSPQPAGKHVGSAEHSLGEDRLL